MARRNKSDDNRYTGFDNGDQSMSAKDELKNLGRDTATQVAQEAAPVIAKGFIGWLKRLFSKRARRAYRDSQRT